ncbi:MAG: hypothetical protein M1404_02235 [Acidobacteria bacterium]|nr:hypothetical protein [Acidobacteriota bacterium]
MKLGFVARACVLMIALGVAPLTLTAQTTVEKTSSASRFGRPLEWPAGPTRNSVPSWARQGLIRFSRWDGGRIETAKGILSGWPHFWPPNPNVLYTTTNWYDPRTIQLLREAGINMIWVTFSNGFSNETEKPNQEQLARYIAECHREGIHVMAYESITNLFWQDMYKRVPESRNWVSLGRNGKPIPYGAAAYKKVGYISRYLANLGDPGWMAYLRKRVALALDAGADGIIYDNNFAPQMTELLNAYHMLYQYGSSRKKDFLLMGNFHENTYVLNRLTNCMTTEDGREPGIYDAAHLRHMGNKDYLLPVGQGFLVDNVGLFRVLDTLSQGWKPNLVEDGRREYGTRETTPMSPERQQLALAEAMSFGVAEEVFVEDAFANELWNHEPQAMAVWKAIGKYNHFFQDHAEYYTGARSVAPVAVVLDDSSRGVPLLNGLGARNVLFDVLYARDLAPNKLARYAAVALLTADCVSNGALAALEDNVRRGGKLLVAGRCANLDEKGQPRSRPFFFGRKIGKGECDYFDQIPPVDKLAEILRADEGTGFPTLEAPPGIVYNVMRQPRSGRLIVHLLNYQSTSAGKIRVRWHGKYRSATLLSPDRPHALPLAIAGSSNHSEEVTVPSLRTYALLVLNP